MVEDFSDDLSNSSPLNLIFPVVLTKSTTEYSYNIYVHMTVSAKILHVSIFHTNECKTTMVVPIFNCFTPKYSWIITLVINEQTIVNVTMNNYKVIRFQTSKIGKISMLTWRVLAETITYSQVASQPTCEQVTSHVAIANQLS